MIEAYKNYWKQYVDFTGVTSRSGFWWTFLMNVIIGVLLYIVYFIFFAIGAAAVVGTEGSDGAAVGLGIIALLIVAISWIWSLANLIPSIALTVRRLRDAGYYWPWIFIAFVPAVGWIILLVLLCQPTKQPVFVQAQFYQGQINNFSQSQAQQPFQQADAFTQEQNNQQVNVAPQPQQAMQTQVATPEVQPTVSEQASPITSEASQMSEQ